MMVGQGRKPKIPVEERPAWARRLIAARKAAGFNGQQAAADKMEIPQSKLGDWEASTTEPDLAEFAKAANLYKVPPEYLAFGVVGQPSEQDGLIGPLIDRYSKDQAFAMAFGRTVAMLAEEGVYVDLHAGLKLATKIYHEAKASSDQGGVRERIELAIARERQDFRRAVADALEKRIQP